MGRGSVVWVGTVRHRWYAVETLIVGWVGLTWIDVLPTDGLVLRIWVVVGATHASSGWRRVIGSYIVRWISASRVIVVLRRS